MKTVAEVVALVLVPGMIVATVRGFTLTQWMASAALLFAAGLFLGLMARWAEKERAKRSKRS